MRFFMVVVIFETPSFDASTFCPSTLNVPEIFPSDFRPARISKSVLLEAPLLTPIEISVVETMRFSPQGKVSSIWSE